MDSLLRDLKSSARSLLHRPALTIVAIITLAVGIGATSAIFSVVDALLLRPLPYPHSGRLANIWLHSPGLGIFRDWPSPGQYVDIQNENRSFEETAIAQLRSMTLTGLEQPEGVDGMQTSSALLRMLGAKPLYSRLLLPEEDKPENPAVVILSHPLWRRLFNSDADTKIAVYFPQQQDPDRDVYLAVRTSSDPAALTSAVVREIHGVDSNAAVYAFAPCRTGSTILWRVSVSLLLCWARSRPLPCCWRQWEPTA